MSDPFAPVTGRIYYVDSAAGSGKTYSAVGEAIQGARENDAKYIICMPTLELIREFTEFARRNKLGVPIIEISSREDATTPRSKPTTTLLWRHLRGRDEKDRPLKGYPSGGQLVFTTHETFTRMLLPGHWIESRLPDFWPPEARQWHLIIDETPEVILTRQPFKLHDSSWVLTSFLEAVEITGSPCQGAPASGARRKLPRPGSRFSPIKMPKCSAP